MRKGLIVLLAAVLVAAFALPAAADLSTSGFVRVKARTQQNYQVNTNANLFTEPMKDPHSQAFVEQRQRFIFDWNSENVGARAYFEIDFGAWGDSAYQSGSRNAGAALEGDSINLETKNVYIWFNVPNTSMKFQVGLQSVMDSYDAVLFGTADMAGIFLTGKLEPVEYRLAWAKWQEGSVEMDNDVDLFIAEVGFSPTKDAKLRLNVYALRDASGDEGGAVAGNTNSASQLFSRILQDYSIVNGSFNYTPSIFYTIGLDGSVKVGPAAISGWAFYQFGKFENANLSFDVDDDGIVDTVLASEDLDQKAWAASLRADLNVGPGKFFLAGAYVSGTDLSSDNDYKTIITGGQYATAGSFPFYKWDMQILFPNGDDINQSSALAYDANNKGRGLMAFAAGYSQKFTDMVSGKIGVGYLTDAETIHSDIDKHKAIEVNANVNYAMLKGLDLGLYGAYAFLTDWEDYGSTGVAQLKSGSTTQFEEADDIYKIFARLNYSF